MFNRRNDVSARPRLILGVMNEELSPLLYEFMESVRTIASREFGCTARWDQDGVNLTVRLSEGGKLSMSPANLTGVVLSSLHPGLHEAWVVSFQDLPRKSRIDEGRAKSFYAAIGEEAQRRVSDPRYAQLTAGLEPTRLVLAIM